MSNGYQPPEYQPPQQPPYQPPQYYQPSPQKKGGIGKWIALGGIGCFLMVAFAAGAFYLVYKMTGGSEPVNVINQHLLALRSGDIEKAYSYTSGKFKEATSLQDFQNFVESYPILQTATEFTSMNREMENGVTSLKGNIHAGDGTTQEAEYQMLKEEGAWKILYIHLTGAGTPAEPKETEQEPGTEEDADQTDVQGGDETAEPPEALAGEGLEIGDVTVDKTSSADAVNVNIEFKVKQVAVSSDNQIHVVQDLVTLDPSGNEIPDLTIPNFKEQKQRIATNMTNIVVTFKNYLTIPTSFPQGTYTARLIVHDKISGQNAESEAQFDIP